MELKDFIEEEDEDFRVSLEKALTAFIKKDFELITLQTYENTFTFRLALYLYKFFGEKKFTFDFEYNKSGCIDKKMLIDGKEVSLRPDLIVHKRKLSSFCAFELKKKSLSEKDKEKLKGLTNKYGTFAYKYGIGVSNFKKNKTIRLSIYTNGDIAKKDGKDAIIVFPY